jgi:hypothetical protein
MLIILKIIILLIKNNLSETIYFEIIVEDHYTMKTVKITSLKFRVKLIS